jgi:CO/xanthine dehydrogenase FAD-binding subunit
MSYLRPRTVEEAVEMLAEPACILAGGTDVFPALVDRPTPARIVDLSRLEGLSAITLEPGLVRIGARVTWSALIRAPLPPCFDMLKQAAREVGSVQIQNAATIAGNLVNASPAADGVSPLLALDAFVEIAGPAGRRRVALVDFITGYRKTVLSPGELVTAILVPRTIDSGRSVFLKLGTRRYLVISIAMVAAVVRLDAGRVAEARVAIGACSAVAKRLPALEDALVGADLAAAPLSSRVTAGHLAHLDPIDDVRATAAYRREAALELVRRALDACTAEPDTAEG